MNTNSLKRFYKAQENIYEQALKEIRQGRKTRHWMWFIFPQLTGLGHSETARFYAISSMQEAELYLQDPVLSERLITISEALLAHSNKTAYMIFGSPDDMKLQSSMTLFSMIEGAHPVFDQVLNQFYEGKKDERTLKMLHQ